MFEVITQAAFLICCGMLWQKTRPMGITPDTARRVITGLVYILLLPALVLNVMWTAPLGIETLQIAASALFGLTASLLIAWLVFKRMNVTRATVGAMLLASTFPNATYLGLPVLEATLGGWASSVAIQYDLLACTPFLLTVGILIAGYYGNSKEKNNPLLELIRVPPLWAALLGIGFNLLNMPQTEWINSLLSKMSAGVIPLMLIAIGLGLSWPKAWQEHIKVMIPAHIIQLIIAPLLVLALGISVGIGQPLVTAIVLEAAMPCMVVGIVLCDRFNLNTQLYAATVTASTMLSVITLPLWHALLTG